MANEQNLIPQAHKLTVEDQSKGGKCSAKARQERKTVQNMLTSYFDGKIKDDKQLQKLAAKIGVDGEESVKYLFTIVFALNTLKKGEFKDLELMMKLLGETPTTESTEAAQQAEFLEAVKKAVGNENK